MKYSYKKHERDILNRFKLCKKRFWDKEELRHNKRLDELDKEIAHLENTLGCKHPRYRRCLNQRRIFYFASGFIFSQREIQIEE